jgi:hypothetical protein
MKSHKNDKRRLTSTERVWLAITQMSYTRNMIGSMKTAVAEAFKPVLRAHANATLVRYKARHRRAKVR